MYFIKVILYIWINTQEITKQVNLACQLLDCEGDNQVLQSVGHPLQSNCFKASKHCSNIKKIIKK